MCFSFEVSILTYIFGMLSAFIIGFKKELILPIVFTQMQLIEGLIWKFPQYNYILSILAFLIIFIEPIASIISYSTNYYMIIFYLILTPYIFNNTDKFITTIGRNGHLRWNWLDLNWIQIILFAFFLLYPIKNILGLIFTIFILVISLYYGYNDQTFGTNFCYWINLIWIYLLIKGIFESF